MTPEQEAMLRRVEIRLELASLREQLSRLTNSHGGVAGLAYVPEGVSQLMSQITRDVRNLTAELESLGGKDWRP